MPLASLACTPASMVPLTVPLLWTGMLRNLGAEGEKQAYAFARRHCVPSSSTEGKVDCVVIVQQMRV